MVPAHLGQAGQPRRAAAQGSSKGAHHHRQVLLRYETAHMIDVVVRGDRADERHLVFGRKGHNALHVPARIDHVALARYGIADEVNKVARLRRGAK
eukprot:4263882-Prymnesium_polylepis.2